VHALADVIKLMFKEELRPRAADPIPSRWRQSFPPRQQFAAFAVALRCIEARCLACGNATVAAGGGRECRVLVIFAISSMSVYGIVLAAGAPTANTRCSAPTLVGADDQLRAVDGMSLASVLLPLTAVACRHRE